MSGTFHHLFLNETMLFNIINVFFERLILLVVELAYIFFYRAIYYV